MLYKGVGDLSHGPISLLCLHLLRGRGIFPECFSLFPSLSLSANCYSFIMPCLALAPVEHRCAVGITHMKRGSREGAPPSLALVCSSQVFVESNDQQLGGQGDHPSIHPTSIRLQGLVPQQEENPEASYDHLQQDLM